MATAAAAEEAAVMGAGAEGGGDVATTARLSRTERAADWIARVVECVVGAREWLSRYCALLERVLRRAAAAAQRHYATTAYFVRLHLGRSPYAAIFFPLLFVAFVLAGIFWSALP
jgi:hypothetical protein